MIETVKLAMRLSTDAYDGEITRLIDAACGDLGIVDVEASSDEKDPLLQQAIITYCRLHFGTPEYYVHLKASCDEQKAQLMTASGYGQEG